MEYTTADGQKYKLSGDKFTTLLLNGTITLDPDIYNDTDDKPTVDKNDEYVKNMKAMFDAKWEELKEIGFDDGSGGDPTPSPSPDPKKVFTKIALVSLGTSLIAVAGAFVKDLFDGKVEGLNLGTYLGYEDYSFLGSVPVDVNGNFMYRGKVGPVNSLRPLYGFVKANYPYRLCAYINRVSNSSAVVVGRLTSSGYIENLQVWYEGYSIDKASAESGRIGYSYMYFGNETYSFNFPFFESTEDAINYLKTGSLTGLLNGEAYDFPDLVKSVPEVLQPLTGTKFSPSLLPGINTAVSNAVKSLPETSTDTKANTETYKETMTSTITDVAPKTEVVPQPSTTPGTETGEGTEGEAYKRDLRLIFPFCIPFDFIHFIQALSADPVAPCFKIPIKLDSLGIDMVLELDLAWMDPIMEIFRLGELGCFVIMLMASTKKMIGW